MAFYLKCKRLDLSTGGKEAVAVLNQKEADVYGIMGNDKILLQWSKNNKMVVDIQFTDKRVEPGYVGLFKDIWKGKTWIDDEQIVEVSIEPRPQSLEAIRKNILQKPLSYDEFYAIIKDAADDKLSDVELTYFVASSFIKKYTLDERYYMVKAMAETGEILNFGTKVVDKHSIGGVPGNRVTMVVTPIIASLGLTMPKTSSRAITSPAGTADTMEVLAPVSFSSRQIKSIVKKTGACMVWGGGLKMAPADDKIIQVSRPLGMEPHAKMIMSIMAKKVAMGVDYLVVDLPYGLTAKVRDLKTANEVAKIFVEVGRKFKMKVEVIVNEAHGPVGQGVGPALEARDVLRVLQQHKLRPTDLEKKAVLFAGKLLELKGYCRKGQGKLIAEKQLENGAAAKKMDEIIIAQGGQKDLKADEVILGAERYEFHAEKTGKVNLFYNTEINEICMALGAPHEKIAGIHFHVSYGSRVKKGDKIFTLYASSKDRMNLAVKALEKIKILNIG